MSGSLAPLLWIVLGAFWWCLILVGAGVTFYRSKRRSRGGRGKRRNLTVYAATVTALLVAAWFWPQGRDWLVIPLFSPVLLFATPLLIPLLVLIPGFGLIWWSQRKIAQRFPVPAVSSEGSAARAGLRTAVASKVIGVRPRTLALAWLGGTLAIAAMLFLVTSASTNLTWFGRAFAPDLSAAADAIPFFGFFVFAGAAFASALLVSLAHLGARMLGSRTHAH